MEKGIVTVDFAKLTNHNENATKSGSLQVIDVLPLNHYQSINASET
jgi:hypothetical protein